MTSALESKDADTTEKNYEASNKSLQDGICSKPGGNGIDPGHSIGRESSVEHTEKPISHHEYSSWSSNPYSINIRPCQLNAFHGPFHPFIVNHKFQYAPIKMAPIYYSPCYQFQEFQYFVVIDFEATCDKERKPYPQEIIEFPSVIVSGLTGQLEACFQTYVRPTCNQLLTDFCKNLTGIQQIQVDRGVTLGEALVSHDKWLESKGIKNSNFAVVTWSDWDCKVMLESECRFKNIKKPAYFDRWINLRVPFSEVFVGERCNLKEAVEKAGLSWQGRPHCGLDDAKNTARLLQLLMHKGFKFSITNSVAGPTSDCEYTPPVPKSAHVSSPPRPVKPRELHFPLVQCVPCCYCGVGRSKGMVRKPGPKQGSIFFGCGNWTYERGARCQYFEWATSG